MDEGGVPHSHSDPSFLERDEELNEKKLHSRSKGELENESFPEDEEEANLVAEVRGEHVFYRSTFRLQMYCEHCQEALRGYRKQGFKCEGKEAGATGSWLNHHLTGVVCRAVVHKQCMELVNTPCYHATLYQGENKEEETEEPPPVRFNHFWNPGNVRAGRCSACYRPISSKSGAFDCSRCPACHVQVHNKCKERAGCCVPPHGNQLFCEELMLKDSNPPSSYQPLLVFVNAKSGGQQGLRVLRQMRKLLSNEQVISLMDETPGMFCLRPCVPLLTQAQLGPDVL